MTIDQGTVQLENPFDPLDWAQVFSQARPIVLDLGAGDGGFALAYAQQRPDCNLLAVERLLGRATKIARRASRLGLDQVRVLRFESSYLLRYLVPPASVQEIHLLFPDPWPKHKHKHHRIVQPAFLQDVVRVLQPGGLFRFVTDHAEYFQKALPLIQATPGLIRAESEPTYPVTDFERHFREQGLPIYSCSSSRSPEG